MNICRLCLQGNIPLYDIVDSGLKTTLEKITEIVVNDLDGYPRVVCLVCRAYLKKCDKLIQMSLKSEQLLREIITKKVLPTAVGLSASDRICSLVVTLPDTVSYQADCIDVQIKEEFDDVYYRPIKTECVNFYDTEFDFDYGHVSKNTEESSLLQVKTEDSARIEYDHHEEGDFPMCGASRSRRGNYVCEHCTLEFKVDKQLQQHIIESHKIEKLELNNRTDVKCLGVDSCDTYILETDCTKVYDKCKTCNKNVDTKLNKHVITYPGKKSLEVICDTNIVTKKDSTNKLVEVSFKCPVCNLAFTTNRLLLNHMKTHKGEKPFKCTRCSLAFTRLVSLQNHMRNHTGEKPFTCRVCNKTFGQIYLLYSHMKAHGECTFKCTFCDKEVNRNRLYKIHMMTHTGEKPYKCDVCGDRFNAKWNLQCHMRKHSGERPYSCNVCGKRFSYNYPLITHMRIHTGEKSYKCDKCGRCFRRLGCLKRHMTTHDAERPFICDICKKGFKLKNYLAIHMSKHNIRKPFKCKHCSKSFRFIASLHRHKNDHRKSVPRVEADNARVT